MHPERFARIYGNVNKNQENIHVVPKPIFSHYQSISDSKSENVSVYVVSAIMKWNS
jgi:hypothetical protein